MSVTPSHVNLLIKENHTGAKILKKLKTHLEDPLAAILTLNTIANTIGAAGVGAQVLKLYGNEWVALASTGLTLSILIFSEIIPKTLGSHHWKTMSPYCAFVIRGLMFLTFPFVVLLRFVSRLVAPKGKAAFSMSREEMIVAAEMGHQEGVLEEKEQNIIKNLLRLKNILVEDIMTPRSVVFCLQKDETIGKIIKEKSPIFFSRIPVYDKDIDNIIGMTLRFKIIEAHSRDEFERPVSELLLPIKAVSHSQPIANTLDEFIKRREHLFIVTDDHGDTAGIVTLEDVIETLLGVEIVDEFDSVEDMRKFALEQWENRKKSRKYQQVGQS